MKTESIDWTSYRNVIDTIESLKDKRITNKVLHCHPSPLFWNHCTSFDEFMLKRQKDLGVKPKQLVVYVALPFCIKTDPPDCGYCLFPHVEYRNIDELKKYLGFLKREGEIYRQYVGNQRVKAIYFGGGTPNIYKEEHYEEIMNLVVEQFPGFTKDVEITFEGIPWLFSRKKLIALKSLGVKRISLGIQQLDTELIKKSGRRQDPVHVLKVINWCHELDLKVSADLIYGWPGQTAESMLTDLEVLTDNKISHITNYELNLGGRTDFSRNRRQELPGNRENLKLFLQIKRYLEEKGYFQVSTNDFARIDGNGSNVLRFEECMRTIWNVDSECNGYDMWGWGFGGISYFMGTPDNPGSAFMNSTNLVEYFKNLSENKPPIKRMYNYSREDLRIAWIFQALQSLRINTDIYKHLFKSDVYDDYKLIWQALERLGWIDITDDRMILLKEGIYYTPLIQSLISEKRVEEIRRAG